MGDEGRPGKLRQLLAAWIDEERAAYCRLCRGNGRQAGGKGCARCPHRMPRLRPRNRHVWRLWLAVQTQWRFSSGIATGLDYLGVAECARWLGLDLRTPRLRTGLQLLEEQALVAWSEKRRRERPPAR